MNFAYLKAVLADVQQQVAEALDGMEQSSRWDRLKRVQAMLESAVDAVGVTEKGLDETEAALGKSNDQTKELNACVKDLTERVVDLDAKRVALESELAQVTHKYDELLALGEGAEAKPMPEPVPGPVDGSAPEAAASVTE